jgi:hypothetical protein
MGRSNKYLEWDEHAVGDWLTSNGLQEYAPAFVQNKIKGRDLSEVISDTDTLAGRYKYMQTVLRVDYWSSHHLFLLNLELIESSFWRKKAVKKIGALISSGSSGSHARVDNEPSNSPRPKDNARPKQSDPTGQTTGGSSRRSSVILPSDKSYHYFLSHKKDVRTTLL